MTRSKTMAVATGGSVQIGSVQTHFKAEAGANGIYFQIDANTNIVVTNMKLCTFNHGHEFIKVFRRPGPLGSSPEGEWIEVSQVGALRGVHVYDITFPVTAGSHTLLITCSGIDPRCVRFSMSKADEVFADNVLKIHSGHGTKDCEPEGTYGYMHVHQYRLPNIAISYRSGSDQFQNTVEEQLSGISNEITRSRSDMVVVQSNAEGATLAAAEIGNCGEESCSHNLKSVGKIVARQIEEFRKPVEEQMSMISNEIASLRSDMAVVQSKATEASLAATEFGKDVEESCSQHLKSVGKAMAKEMEEFQKPVEEQMSTISNQIASLRSDMAVVQSKAAEATLAATQLGKRVEESCSHNLHRVGEAMAKAIEEFQKPVEEQMSMISHEIASVRSAMALVQPKAAEATLVVRELGKDVEESCSQNLKSVGEAVESEMEEFKIRPDGFEHSLAAQRKVAKELSSIAENIASLRLEIAMFKSNLIGFTPVSAKLPGNASIDHAGLKGDLHRPTSLKIKFNGDIYRLCVSSQTAAFCYDDVKRAAESALGRSIESLKATYIDEEGDQCILNASTFSDFLLTAGTTTSRNNLLKFDLNSFSTSPVHTEEFNKGQVSCTDSDIEVVEDASITESQSFDIADGGFQIIQGSGCCFIKRTLLPTPDGDYKTVNALQVGDHVLGSNGQQLTITHKIGHPKMLQKLTTFRTSSTELTVTNDHRVVVHSNARTEKSAAALEVGDVVVCGAKQQKVTKVLKFEQRAEVVELRFSPDEPVETLMTVTCGIFTKGDRQQCNASFAGAFDHGFVTRPLGRLGPHSVEEARAQGPCRRARSCER